MEYTEPTMSQQRASSVILIVALILIPSIWWLERAQPDLWKERLFLPNLEEVTNKHTPLFSTGRRLPATVAANLTLSPQDNPVIIEGATTIPAGVTLTIQPGTHIYAAEFGQLHVNGKILAQGTPEKEITFATNEVHPLNTTWNGIVLAGNSESAFEYVYITNASPGITCEANSRAAITRVIIKQASMGIFTASPGCIIQDVHFGGVREAIITTY